MAGGYACAWRCTQHCQQSGTSSRLLYRCGGETSAELPCKSQVGHFEEFTCRLLFQSMPRGHLLEDNLTTDEPAVSGHGNTEHCSVTATDRHVILFGGVVHHTNLYSNKLYILEKATMIWTVQVCHSEWSISCSTQMMESSSA